MSAAIKANNWRYEQPLRIDALPTSSSYRQVLCDVFKIAYDEHTVVSELKAATAAKWAETGSAEHADWLRVPLGITSGNRIRTLALEAKKDGAHGLIAGGTGSGKSELLMTLIVGLALYQSPDILNFVLVDYKGGGAFRPFEKLPHVVDIVTNLNKAGVDRMFTAIAAEIRRRQALNADTGTKDIVDYRKRGLHLKGEAYPHLFIIIDEYSEMIDDNPEYRQQLDSITRVGRAQGVNLILASQQPKGVSDQMRANIKLRLCLRVEQQETSRELLRRPDAAFLPNGMPGRGYMQVGNDTLEHIQVSWTGENQPITTDDAVTWPDRPPRTEPTTTDDTPKMYDAAIAIASELYGGKMARKPWPSFLPAQFSLETPLVDRQQDRVWTLQPAVTDWINDETANLWSQASGRADLFRPVVGLVDEPAEARQFPLQFDLARTHLVIMGDSGVGKTTLLRSLLVSMAATHSPDEFHAYVLDLGGRNFRSLEALPHVGAVIYADDDAFEERLQRLLAMLETMALDRAQLLSDRNAGSVQDFNARFPAEALPGVVVMIDNMAQLQENFETLIETTLLPLVRRSLGVGITFVLTANVPNNMPTKLYNLMNERVTFRQSNFDRYGEIVGRGAINIGDIPGRGYIRIGTPLFFHVALPVGKVQPDGRMLRPESDEIAQMVQHMHAFLERKGTWRSRPDSIPILPELVTLPDVLAEADPPTPRRIHAVLGRDASLLPAAFDLKRMGPHFMVAGPPMSGKTTTLHSWLLSLAERYGPEQVRFVLIDTQRKLFDYGGDHSLSDLPHVLATASEVEEIGDVLTKLATECRLVADDDERAIFVIIDNFDDFHDEIESQRTYIKDWATLARRYGRSGLHFVISGTLDGPTNDLRKRIQAASYGIGLRTAQAIETLKVTRTPAAARGRPLGPGRGFVVKAGQATMIQVGTPYQVNGNANGNGAALEEEELVARALDHWVQALTTKYPGRKATWTVPPELAVSEADFLKEHPKLARLVAVLRHAIDAQPTDGDTPPLVTEPFVQSVIQAWVDEPATLALLRPIWIETKVATGIPRDMGAFMADTMDIMGLTNEFEATWGEPASAVST